jgi:hypothetical protein
MPETPANPVPVHKETLVQRLPSFEVCWQPTTIAEASLHQIAHIELRNPAHRLRVPNGVGLSQNTAGGGIMLCVRWCVFPARSVPRCIDPSRTRTSVQAETPEGRRFAVVRRRGGALDVLRRILIIHQQNPKRFRTLLAETKDETRRQLLWKLLAAEEQSARCSSTALNVGRSYEYGHAGSASQSGPRVLGSTAMPLSVG